MGNIQKDRDERVTNIENCDRYNYLFDRMSSGVVFCKAIYNQSGDMVDCIYKDMNAAYEKFTNLKKETTIGKKVSELNDESIRELSLYSYRIIYEINNLEIFVLGVIHKRRDLEKSDIDR